MKSQRIFRLLYNVLICVSILLPYESFAMNDSEGIEWFAPQIDQSLLESWVTIFVDLDNEKNKQGCEEAYSEVSRQLNEIKPDERLEALLKFARLAFAKKSEHLSNKVLESLTMLYIQHFKGSDSENYALASIESVELMYNCTFKKSPEGATEKTILVPSKPWAHNGNRKKKKARKEEKEKEREKEKEAQPENETTLDDGLCEMFKEQLIGTIADHEIFQITFGELLDSLVSNEPLEKFNFVEALIKKEEQEDSVYAQGLFNYLNEVLYLGCLKGSDLDKHYNYRGRVNALSPIVKKNNLSIDDFHFLSGEDQELTEVRLGHFPDQVADLWGRYKEEELSTTSPRLLSQGRWLDHLESKGGSRANAIIDKILFNPLKNKIAFIDIPKRELIRYFETKRRFPMLITKDVLPDNLPGIRKKMIVHPNNSNLLISLLWSTERSKLIKVLLLGNYLVRSYRDGSLEVDDFEKKNSFCFKAKQQHITSLIAHGDDEFVSSSMDGYIDVWNLREKKRTICLPTEAPVKGLNLIHNILYGVIGNGIYALTLTKENRSFFPLQLIEGADITCVADGANPKLCIGLSDGKIKVFEDVLEDKSSIIKISENPIKSITIQEGMILAQDTEGVIVRY